MDESDENKLSNDGADRSLAIYIMKVGWKQHGFRRVNGGKMKDNDL